MRAHLLFSVHTCSCSFAGLEFVSRCSELIELKLGLCQKISDQGLFHIGSNCKKLQELDLYRLTNCGIYFIPEHQLVCIPYMI